LARLKKHTTTSPCSVTLSRPIPSLRPRSSAHGGRHKYHSLQDSFARAGWRRPAATTAGKMPALLSWTPVAFFMVVRCEVLQGACFWRETRRSRKRVTSAGYGSLLQKPQILCCPPLA
jgi:hypothetical protein